MEQKTNGPGIFLMIVGVIGILGALVSIPSNMVQLRSPEIVDAFMEAGIPLGAITGISVCGGLLALAGSVLALVAGMKLRNLESYGLVMTGAILAMLPCTNGCCCLGLPAGIWALVVLMDPQVKAAFR